MYFENNKRLSKEIKELRPEERQALMFELLDAGTINFVDLATSYIEVLKTRNKKKNDSIAVLGLMLATYCIHDPSTEGKNARKHLYEAGQWGNNDGTPFGKILDEEFKNDQ